MSIIPTDRNRRVLIVDDNRSIHDDFRKILLPVIATEVALDAAEVVVFGAGPDGIERVEFEVDSAYQGQEGADMVQKALDTGRPYAMAFVDVRMPPGWDGVETTIKIWELDPDLQIVLCTAYSDYSWSELFGKLSRRDGLLILKKPFDAIEAFQLAHGLTEKWSLHKESRRKMEGLESQVAGRTLELQRANQTLQAEVIEHKRAQESLRLLGTAVEQAREAILITDAQIESPGPRILFNNPAFTTMTGYSSEDVIGKTPRILHGPRTDRAVLARLRKNMERGEVFEGEAVNYRKDGSEFVLEWQITPIRNALGSVTHFVAIQRDMTERRRLENQLFQSQKMETVGRLAGGIAHEFNSIMTAIIGQSEMLLNELLPENPLHHNSMEIRHAAERASILTRQLLAYGRKQLLRPEILDLNLLLAGMENSLRHMIGVKSKLIILPHTGIRAIKADAGQIEQVIMNLTANAADAMPNGGKLILETANIILDEQYLHHIPELKPGEYVMLAVTDTGTGMKEEVRLRVFEPFFTTKGVGLGTGLGLSTSYGIVKQSGGQITVYSEPGRGATFKIYLPAVEHEAKISIRRESSPLLPRGTETILLVEDDPALREMASSLLRQLGYTVLAAQHGVEALNLVNDHPLDRIDILFTDLVMPHMSGIELSVQIATMHPRIRTLFTSAYTENSITHQGILGKDAILLQKPFTPSALAHKLRETMATEHLNSETDTQIPT